jgi:hypothetical protein
MKNIHLLPTSKPSRLHLGNSGLVLCDLVFNPTTINSQNIYITSDEEIKVGDYIIELDGNEVFRSKGVMGKNDWCKKIILTTDQDLINDGIQAIDDEFLEWFVKNPSCQYGGYKDIPWDKIITLKEEPKQYPIGGYAPGYYGCICVTCKTEFTGDKRALQCEPCAIKTAQEEPKQETLEEVALNIIPDKSTAGWIDSFGATERIGFIKGAKWQAKRMYSEEDMRKCWDACKRFDRPISEGDAPNFNELIEQIKKYKYENERII